jgi:hypothetical protein
VGEAGAQCLVSWPGHREIDADTHHRELRSPWELTSEANPEGDAGWWQAAEKSTERLYNFSAGPAMLPMDVLERAQTEMVDWHGSGMSVMEMSHRGKEFMSIASKVGSRLPPPCCLPGPL